VQIIIHIIKGHNIPVRNASAPLAKKLEEYDAANTARSDLPWSGQPLQGRGPEMGALPKGVSKFIPPPKITRVNSFVEVRLVSGNVSQSLKTHDVEGVHPDWNEMLTMELHPKDDFFTNEEILGSRDILYFTIFDEVNFVDTEGEVKTIKREKRFLGSFSIPLFVVFENKSRLEAMCRVARPLLVFGYYTSTQNLFGGRTGTAEPAQSSLSPTIPTFVTLSVSIDPPIDVAVENEREYYPGAEEITLLISGTKWIKDLQSDPTYAKRSIRLFAENLNRESVFLPRYLRPLAPPPSVVDLTSAENDVAIETAARYVSLIPFIADTQAFNDLPDMWSTCQEFLDLGYGDYEEHAMLLCNYFNYIDNKKGRNDVESYLVIGKGIPEGVTCYVMRRDKRTHSVEFWNPVKGEAYYFGCETVDRSCLCIPCGQTLQVTEHESFCPLKEVGCVVGATNIYANLQPLAEPATLLYNLEDTSLWAPFLTESITKKYYEKGIPTVQPEELIYVETQPELAQELEHKVEVYIAEKFERARGERTEDKRPMRTRWAKGMAEEMRGLLTTFEQYKSGVRTGARNSRIAQTHAFSREEEQLLGGVKDVSELGNRLANSRTNRRRKRHLRFPLKHALHEQRAHMGRSPQYEYIGCLDA
jgi:coiled-coil and C2 domain-containing protein 2A